jgi:hypothetical protein
VDERTPHFLSFFMGGTGLRFHMRTIMMEESDGGRETLNATEWGREDHREDGTGGLWASGKEVIFCGEGGDPRR